MIYEEDDACRATVPEWLNFPHEDVAVADLVSGRPEQPLDLAETVCRYARQIAENSLTAVLFLEPVEVPPTHELHELAELLPDQIGRRTAGLDLDWLLRQGFRRPYPGYGSRPSADDARYA